MKATIAFHESTRGTLAAQTATGHAVFVNVRGGNRVVILLDDADHHAVERLLDGAAHLVKVTDLITETSHWLGAAACGLRCRCAVEFRASPK